MGASDKRDGRVTLDAVLDVVGRRSFGPFLLVCGLITLAPIIGDIPGVPTLIGIGVIIVAIQLFFRRDHFWLPQWLLQRSISTEALDNVLGYMQKPARFIDSLIKPRLTVFTKGPAVYLIAIACMIIAASTPPMELIPFSANLAGAALTAFGLALIAHDGLLALIALAITSSTIWLVVSKLLL